MSDKKKHLSPSVIISALLVPAYTAACIYLYYRYLGWTEGAVYESDLPGHISLALDDKLIYSLISLIIIGLDKIGIMKVLPVLLGVFAALSVMFTSFLITEITDKKIPGPAADILAVCLNIFMPCYIRGLSSGRYMGMHTSSIWHNSTYLMMKWLGLWTLLIYIKIEKDISEKLTVKSFALFTLVLTLTTAAKPSFFLAVTPVMFIYLIIDLVKKTAPAGRLILFASSVIPSFAVMIVQKLALYNINAGDDHIILAPGKAMGIHAGNILAVSILSIAFPLMVLLIHLKDLLKNRYLLFAWMSAGFGYLEYFLLGEEGHRNMDANFSWGYAFTIILIFGISLIMWIEDLRRTGKSKLMAVYLGFCGVVLAYHTYCGVLFFVRIVRGVSYMMWG